MAYVLALSLSESMKDSCLRLRLLTVFADSNEAVVKAAYDTGAARVGSYDLPLIAELAEQAADAEWPTIYKGLVDGVQDGLDDHC